ncbi:MAG: hypothetical protein HQK98_10755 [Nitrospirae bacterium]|nr:hypothetical protein [Nitrospirota bacterium]
MESLSNMPELPILPILIEEIRQFGQLTAMEGNRQIPLTDPQSVWIVWAGAIDILSYSSQTNSDVFGKRYLFALETGALIIGVREAEGGVGLMAQGKAGSSLMRLPRERLIGYISDDTYDVPSLIDGWLRRLLRYSHSEFMPLQATLIDPGKEYARPQPGCFRTSKDIVWIKPSTGNLSFAGMKESLQIPNGAMFPISDGSFVESEGECRFNTLSTKDYLAADPDWTNLDSSQDMMLVSIKLTAFLEMEHEKQRLRLKTEQDNNMMGAALANVMFQLTGSIAMLRAEGKIDASLQAAVWDRLLSLPASFFRRYTVGDLSNRAMGIDGIRQLITGSVTNTIISSAFSIFSFFILFYYNLWLALSALAIVVVVTVITASLSYMMVNYQHKILDLSGKISGIVYQLIGAIGKFRVSGSEMRGFAQWAGEFRAQKSHTFNSNLVKCVVTALNSIYPVISFLILYGIYYYKDMFKLLSMGDFLSFSSAFTQFLTSGIQLSATLVNVLAVIPIYNRAKPIFLSMPEVTREKTEPGDLSGDIEIKNVWFRYQAGGRYITSRSISMPVSSLPLSVPQAVESQPF